MQLVKEETQPAVEVVLDMEKLPFHKAKIQYVKDLKEFIERMNNRKKMLAERAETQDEFNRNEDAILSLKTDNELRNAHTQVLQNEENIKKDLDAYKLHYNEVNTRFVDTVAKAREKVEKDAYKKDELTMAAKQMLDEINMDILESNFGAKYNSYWKIKQYVFPNQENAMFKKS